MENKKRVWRSRLLVYMESQAAICWEHSALFRLSVWIVKSKIWSFLFIIDFAILVHKRLLGHAIFAINLYVHLTNCISCFVCNHKTILFNIHIMVSKSVVASTLQANYKETHVDRWIWWWASCMRNMLIDAPARPSAAAHTRRYLKFIALRDALKVIVLHSWGFIGRMRERER